MPPTPGMPPTRAKCPSTAPSGCSGFPNGFRARSSPRREITMAMTGTERTRAHRERAAGCNSLPLRIARTTCARSPAPAMRAPQAATTISRRKRSACFSPTPFCKSDGVNRPLQRQTVTASLRVTVLRDDVTLALRRHCDAPPTSSGIVSSGGRPVGRWAITKRPFLTAPQACLDHRLRTRGRGRRSRIARRRHRHSQLGRTSAGSAP
jgi:hypothetical protein